MNKRPQSKQTLLACARKKRGWTQAHVAQLVDVSVDTVRQWERGRHFPYQATIQQLCTLFQMSPGALGLLKEQDIPLPLEKEEILVYAGKTETHNSSESLTSKEANAMPTHPRNAAKSTTSNDSFLLQDIHNIWKPNEEEKQTAWELYIELVTRIPIASLGHGEGILREALSSLYSLFHTARTILRSHSPTIALGDHDTHLSVSYVVIRMLNTVVRPLLAKWHPMLKDYEELRPASVGIAQHEQQWERYTELCQELITVRAGLLAYAQILAEIAEVSSLVIDESEIVSQRPINQT